TLLLAGVITMRSAQGERQARRQLAFEQERQQRERQELSERLGHAERLATLGTLVASVAHEVGGPLTAILGICELRASDPPGSPQDYREDLQLIERSTQRCKAVLDSVRSFSRKRQIEPTSNDFNALIKQCAMLKKYDWVGKIELCEDYAQGLPEITMIPTEFQQVVFNLLTNAQEAILSAKDSGRIWIRTERAGEGVRVLIEDDGPGIPPETLPHIFDAFFTTKPAGQGTGLGLSIVKQLVDHQGGTVSAGQRPGGGARFSVQLPLIPARDTMRRTLVPPPLHGLSA
ncbi:MAG: hypothetical protein KGK30_09130, partial [Elusimicrobia bacterium]|nr:hypothetical protein [Elusimicrobiota bacterium]